MQRLDNGPRSSSPSSSASPKASPLMVLLVFCSVIFFAGQAAAEHIELDLGSNTFAEFVAKLVYAGRIYPDQYPDIIRDNSRYAGAISDAARCMKHLSSVLTSSALANPMGNIRDRAVETWGGNPDVPPEVFAGMPGGGDPRAAAAFQFRELAGFLPDIVEGDDRAYFNSSFYQSSVLLARYYTGSMALSEMMPQGPGFEGMLDEYMKQVFQATMTDMLIMAYETGYASTRDLVDAAC